MSGIRFSDSCWVDSEVATICEVGFLFNGGAKSYSCLLIRALRS